MKNVNNVHLVCRRLHQIANLFVYPKLSIDGKSTKDLESLVQSSRVFEELEFSFGFGDDLLYRIGFEIFQEYLSITGPHIKILIIISIKVDPQIFQNLLNLLPNLEALELDRVKSEDSSLDLKCKTHVIKLENDMMGQAEYLAHYIIL